MLSRSTSVVQMEMKKREDIVNDGDKVDAIISNSPASEDGFLWCLRSSSNSKYFENKCTLTSRIIEKLIQLKSLKP